MALKKLTQENIGELSGKQICLFEKSVSYLSELCERYPLSDQIAFVVDTNERNLGKFEFQHRDMAVFELSHLLQLDFCRTGIVITSDYYSEAYKKIKSVLSGRIENMDIYYFANRETAYEEAYRERYAGCPLENIILFRSGPHASSYIRGMDFADNARALFEYALQIGLHNTYELVWQVKNPTEFEQYKEIENVSFVSYDWSVSENGTERDAYYRVLCLAKYIFFTDAYGFARNCRKDQIRIQLWHGCGFKTRVNFVRCEERYEYTTVISDLYADIHADIYGLRRDQVLVTGYAKEDWLFHPKEEDMRKLQIPEAEQYIFWLPTFRSTGRKLAQLNEYELVSETGLPIVDTHKKMKQLNAALRETNMILLVKLHPFQNREAVHCEGYSNIILLENETLFQYDIPINRLLGWADALISDYSSSAVDYMLLDRPIAFMLEDVEEYEQSRGFVFDNIRDWLPGQEIFTFEDVCAFIGEIDRHCDSTAEKRKRLREKMHMYHDDHSCRRILEAIGILEV